MTIRPWGRPELLVLQPTPFCNLDCDYCYLTNRSSTARMSTEVLKRAFELFLGSDATRSELTVVWHAGEPMVLPPRFYDDAIRLANRVKRADVEVHHALQTNATLVDSRWCDLFKRNDIRVGVSLDGPAFLHDAHRRTRRGEGTHELVMRGVRRLQQEDVDFHVIAVLTLESLQEADALYHFFVGNGIRRVGFNVEEIEGANTGSSLNRSDVEEIFRRFMERFLDLVTKDGELVVREFSGLDRFLFDGAPWLSSNQENTPGRITSVDHAGNVSTFSPELLGLENDTYANFRFGNVLVDSLATIRSSSAYRRLEADIHRGIDRCAESCSFFEVCGGGSPSNKYFENGAVDSTETLHCRLTKKVLVDVYLAHLESRLGSEALPELGEPAGSARAH